MRQATRGKNGQPLSRQELADAVGMAKTTLGTLEDNRQHSTAKLHRIAEYFGVRPAWLETGTGEKYVNALREPAPEGLSIYGAPQSQSLTLTPEIVFEALTLLQYDEEKAGDYTPRPQARRLAELLNWVIAEGGRLSDASNRKFEDQVTARAGGKEHERSGVRRKRARSA